MKTKLIALLLFSIILSSCGGSKSTIKDKGLKTKTLRAILKNYDKSSPDFETIRGRIKGTYISDDDRQNVNISYRFKKDEVIWMSAKLAGLIQVAKVMITPESIQFYERIDRSYFDGDFKLVSSFLGIELDYEQLQNLLLGEAINTIEIKKSDFQAIEGYFEIKSTYQNNLNQTILLDDKTFKIKQQTLELNDKKINILYNSYQMVEKRSFPEEILITADNKEDNISLILNFKNINLNSELNFPFNIPDDYKPIQMK